MAKQTIEEMAASLYQDKKLAAAVIADAREKGTTKKIERGELVLPHPVEAARWLQRIADEKASTKEGD